MRLMKKTENMIQSQGDRDHFSQWVRFAEGAPNIC